MNDENQETATQLPPAIGPEELQDLYEQQQQRLACPGCGEEPFIG